MTRIQSIDALRGLVMVIMLLDHVRETYYLHMQVSDPVDVTITEPGLFFIRLLSSLCAPIFVLLTGLGAYLHAQSHSPRDTSKFLLKRGLFLIILEITVINFSWTGKFPPETIYLQVIWVIGLSMVALAGLLYLPRALQFGLAVFIIAGHHVLEPISFNSGDIGYIPWAIFYERSWIDIGDLFRVRTSYPLLPWIGVILLGYTVGPWFHAKIESTERTRIFLFAGLALVTSFIVLRYVNIYGDIPRLTDQGALVGLMSFLSLTKYPPSFLFNLSTIGLGFILLAGIEKIGKVRMANIVATFGAAPMFFYILHLYILKIGYLICLAIFGANHGRYFGVDTVTSLWLIFAVTAFVFYFPTAWFSRLKRRRRDITWLKYL